MRQRLTIIMEWTGMASIVAGVSMASVAGGLVVAGVLLVIYAVAMTRSGAAYTTQQGTDS